MPGRERAGMLGIGDWPLATCARTMASKGETAVVAGDSYLGWTGGGLGAWG